MNTLNDTIYCTCDVWDREIEREDEAWYCLTCEKMVDYDLEPLDNEDEEEYSYNNI